MKYICVYGWRLGVDVRDMGKENKTYFSFDVLLCNVVHKSERIIRIITPLQHKGITLQYGSLKYSYVS